MHPILFHIGPLCIYSYGAMVALGVLLACFLAQRHAIREGLGKEQIIDLVFFVVLWGLIGGRLLYVFLNFPDYLSDPVEILKIYKGGLAFHGSLIAGFIAAVLFIKRHDMPLLKTLDILAVYLPLAHAIGRIGCFLNGCCYGRPAERFGVMFPGSIVPVYPTQLFSSAALVLLFGFLLFRSKRKKFDGEILLSYLGLYGFLRFCMEFLRGDNPPILFGLSVFQLISIVIFSSALLFYVKLRKKNL